VLQQLTAEAWWALSQRHALVGDRRCEDVGRVQRALALPPLANQLREVQALVLDLRRQALFQLGDRDAVLGWRHDENKRCVLRLLLPQLFQHAVDKLRIRGLPIDLEV